MRIPWKEPIKHRGRTYLEVPMMLRVCPPTDPSPLIYRPDRLQNQVSWPVLHLPFNRPLALVTRTEIPFPFLSILSPSLQEDESQFSLGSLRRTHALPIICGWSFSCLSG
ncbi:hypothetical protein CEXT_787061 [Caerostris extrusa]|uniref:Uncharacterized protein n=1 Tax=Caerostris extrusa TaxID=172846 RepID=A0AAV4TGH4_CAEEX|nr:hypothetical protein CEXT_787061 [Caerostris extrusa]